MKTIDVVRYGLLLQFMGSAPIAMIAVFGMGCDRTLSAVVNSYAFSSAMVALYFYPFLWPSSWKEFTFVNRLDLATTNWLIWLSVFTELTFQIPHNLMVRLFHEYKDSAFEWPFYAYGLSDSRWSEYNHGSGLDPYVWFINFNDASLGVVVLAALIFRSLRPGLNSTVMLSIVVLFRDATLFRETVEYMWDMHRKDYPFTIADNSYRIHGIFCLWLVNIIWIVAPVLSTIWAYHQIITEAAPRTIKSL
jgi:hypothetical protein